MKKALLATLQFLLFLLIFIVGTFAHPFNLHWGLTGTTPSVTRLFVADGLVLTITLLAVIIILQAIRKRLCSTPWTLAAFMLAVAAGYAMKLGFITREL